MRSSPNIFLRKAKFLFSARNCRFSSCNSAFFAARYSLSLSKEDYDKWRYRFPEFDTTQIWGKVPSKQLSDALVDAFKDKLKD